MEAMGGALFLDGEWESLCKMFSTEQDPAFDELLGHNTELTKDHLLDDQGLLGLLMGEPIDPIAPFLTQMPNSNHFSQTSSSDLSYDSSNGDHLVQPNVNDDQISCLPSFDFLMEDSLFMGFPSVIEGTINHPMDGADQGDHRLSAKRSCADNQLEMEAEALVPKKRARVSKRANKGKKIKCQQPEKNKNEGAEEETNEASNGLNPSGHMSDNESNASQEVINESQTQTLNMNGKKRANRGAATDPQSLYARRRRERINERLRILQTLVPNGTKVDISTMLEEAVHYVKFLQLQIKLLSSDEMWMYAPLAYSGFDMGLYKRFSPYMPRP